MLKDSGQNRQLFSLYCPDFFASNQIKMGDSYSINDADIYFRLISVLRLKKGEQCILFDPSHHLLAKISVIFKKSVKISVLYFQKNVFLNPSISVILPLLKRDALEQAVYSMVELGVEEIQLVVTNKVQRKWGKDHERKRLEKIMVAAAEQSTNYALPLLHDPTTFFSAVKRSMQHKDAVRIYADMNGISLIPYLSSFENVKKICISIGSEGDLITEEKERLRECGFRFCSLGPTVLRASQAITIMVGICRSYFSTPR